MPVQDDFTNAACSMGVPYLLRDVHLRSPWNGLFFYILMILIITNLNPWEFSEIKGPVVFLLCFFVTYIPPTDHR